MKDLERILRDRDCRERDERRTYRANVGLSLAALLAFVLLLLLTSCTSVHPVAAGGPLDGEKEGRAAVVTVLGVTVKGDGSTRAAALNGGVRDVQTVDVHTVNVLGVYLRSTTIVRGR